MTDEEIEFKIKDLRAKLKELEIEKVKDEERVRSKTEERNKLISQLKEKYPEIDINNLESEREKVKAQLESEMLLFETELQRIEQEIAKNR